VWRWGKSELYATNHEGLSREVGRGKRRRWMRREEQQQD